MPNQRDVVEVQFRLPQGLEAHPVIVISNSSINTIEKGFVAVMMTSEEDYADDLYSFEVKKNMFEQPFDKLWAAVRLHLIGNFLNDDIVQNSHKGQRMTEEAFKRMLVQINRITFRLDNFRLG